MNNNFKTIGCHIEQNKRKKILLLSDDLRMHSGISTMAREMVVGTSHHFNWVQIAGAINHPDKGKKLDISLDVNTSNNITDASVMLYPTDGYGSPDMLRTIMSIEQPDAVMIFTDPRYWIWLFQMESEIRKTIPLIYLNIWDSTPSPYYNRAYYESCDALLAISKQTYNINKIVLGDLAKHKTIQYTPHGISEKDFYPITTQHPEWSEFNIFKTQVLNNKQYEFVLFFNSRNIRRKNPGDVILSFVEFTKTLPKDKIDKVALLMHTDAVDENGTDLNAVRDLLCTEGQNVIITNKKFNPKQMNWLYNMSNISMLISSNEGWGLSLTESMMAGRMIIANVTGGMQDQMRFEDENGKWIEFDENFCSNHFGKYKKCGEWALPVFPSNISLVGSVPTPYIFDDRCDFRDVAKQIKVAYDLGETERQRRGESGRKWVTSSESMMSAAHMCDNIISGIDDALMNFAPKKTFEIIKISDLPKVTITHPITY